MTAENNADIAASLPTGLFKILNESLKPGDIKQLSMLSAGINGIERLLQIELVNGDSIVIQSGLRPRIFDAAYYRDGEILNEAAGAPAIVIIAMIGCWLGHGV